jgi:hypothetical protein
MKLTVEEVAQRMGVTPQFIRMGLRQKVFPWGYAVRMKRWVYYIDREKFERWVSD